MVAKTLEQRVLVVEQRLDQLSDVPARLTAVESQIVHLRSEMRSEFSAVRLEMAEQGASLRQEMAIQGEHITTTLRQEMIRLNEETRGHMRALFEEAISRITTIGEARPPRRRKTQH